MNKSESASRSCSGPDGSRVVPPRRDNPTSAKRIVKTIYDGCATLKAPLPYIAVYRVKEHAVEISRIYHGAQDWP
jgi:plasmid stabilization system protein ParE